MKIKSSKEARLNVDWYEVYEEAGDAGLLGNPKLEGYIFRKSREKILICDHVGSIHCTPLLLTILRPKLDLYRQLRLAKYSKTLMDFEEFKNLVSEDATKKLLSFNVVVPPFIAVDLWALHFSLKEDKEVTLYLNNLKLLEEAGVNFWPSIKECVAHADKLEQAKNLDEIAKTHTKSPRPTTTQFDFDNVPTYEAVVKRSFSDKSAHVYFLPMNSVSDLQKHVRPEAKFLAQTFIPSLRTFGEVRVAISFGEVIWRISTVYNAKAQIWSYVDLTHPRKILGQPITELPPLPFENEYFQLPATTRANLGDIDGFALKTLDGLIKLETRSMGRETSLSTFARLDIGIMGDENGMAYFFVNEVERLPAVTLWQDAVHVGPVAAALDCALYIASFQRTT